MAEEVCSAEEIALELAAKRQRVLRFLEDSRLDAVLISRHENIAWASAGRVDVRVGILRETGVASLLFTKDGAACYLTTNNEALRLAEEEFRLLDMQPLVRPWYAGDLQASVREIMGNAAVASDTPMGAMQVVSLQALRYELTGSEVEHYRWLGSNAAALATELLRELRPGMDERAIQAMAAERLIRRGILPSVYLEAVDERIRRFKHAVPREGVLQKFGMIGFCARRWGLTVAITRFVHFGPMPAELAGNFAAVAYVNARLQAATREGVSADRLFAVSREAYASAGYPGEETMHHQGGATGYMEREWLARPGGRETPCALQAFAWNPSLRGAKVEDTILLRKGSIELLTATPDLPAVDTSFNQSIYRSAGVLIA